MNGNLKKELDELELRKQQLLTRERYRRITEYGFVIWPDHACKRCGNNYYIHEQTRVLCPHCDSNTYHIRRYKCDLCKKAIRDEIWLVGSGYGSHSRFIQTFEYIKAKQREHDDVFKELTQGSLYYTRICVKCFMKPSFGKRMKRLDLKNQIKDLTSKRKRKEVELKGAQNSIAHCTEEISKINAKIAVLKEERANL